MRYGTGQQVEVIATSIQRGNGAAWKGDRGVIVNVTGDGYQIKVRDAVLDNVTDDEVTAA